MSLRKIWLKPRRVSKPSQASNPTAKISKPADTLSQHRSVYSLTKELDQQRSLNRLVEKFKRFSHIPAFRDHKAIYYTIIKRLAAAGNSEGIKEVLEYHKQYNDISNEGFNARLICLYGVARMSPCARKVFDEMPNNNCPRTSLSFNALLKASLDSANLEETLALFHQLPSEIGVEPDIVSYGTVIKALCDAGHFKVGISMLFKMEQRIWNVNSACYNTLLDGLYAGKDIINGDRVWNMMVEKNILPDVKCYTMKAIGYALNKRSQVVSEIVEEMRVNGIRPDAALFRALIKSFAGNGDMEEAKRWYKEARLRMCKVRKVAYEALICLALEKGEMGFVEEVIKDVFEQRCPVEEGLLQKVVDQLLRDSKLQEATQIVRHGQINDYCRYNLNFNSAT